jgi:hypothetical protein
VNLFRRALVGAVLCLLPAAIAAPAGAVSSSQAFPDASSGNRFTLTAADGVSTTLFAAQPTGSTRCITSISWYGAWSGELRVFGVSGAATQVFYAGFAHGNQETAPTSFSPAAPFCTPWSISAIRVCGCTGFSLALAVTSYVVTSAVTTPVSVAGSVEVANDVGSSLGVAGVMGVSGPVEVANDSGPAIGVSGAVGVSGPVEVANDSGPAIGVQGDVGFTGPVEVIGGVDVVATDPLPIVPDESQASAFWLVAGMLAFGIGLFLGLKVFRGL